MVPPPFKIGYKPIHYRYITNKNHSEIGVMFTNWTLSWPGAPPPVNDQRVITVHPKGNHGNQLSSHPGLSLRTTRWSGVSSQAGRLVKLGWLLQGPGNWGDILECSRIVIVIMAIWFTIDYNYGIVYRNPVCFFNVFDSSIRSTGSTKTGRCSKQNGLRVFIYSILMLRLKDES